MVPKQSKRKVKKKKRYEESDNESEIEENFTEDQNRTSLNTTNLVDEGVVNLKPPKPLNVTNYSEMTSRWKKWIKHFNWFAVATQI